MVDYYIKAVHKDGEDTISEVKRSSSLQSRITISKSKSAVVNDIDQSNHSVWTAYKQGGRWKKGDEVHTVEGEWIRTDGNDKKKDNLGGLPEY